MKKLIPSLVGLWISMFLAGISLGAYQFNDKILIFVFGIVFYCIGSFWLIYSIAIVGKLINKILKDKKEVEE